MDNFTIFALSTIPAGIGLIFSSLSKGKIKSYLDKNNSLITKNIENSSSLVKFYKVYKKSTTNTIEDKKLLITSVFFYLIGMFTILFWIIILIFFPSIFFGD